MWQEKRIRNKRKGERENMPASVSSFTMVVELSRSCRPRVLHAYIWYQHGTSYSNKQINLLFPLHVGFFFHFTHSSARAWLRRFKILRIELCCCLVSSFKYNTRNNRFHKHKTRRCTKYSENVVVVVVIGGPLLLWRPDERTGVGVFFFALFFLLLFLIN